MNFRKVSDNELHCSVSAEEIRANGLEISDLLKRSDKTYEFFEYLMQEGQEETGFEKNGPMSVEGVFLNGNLELIFRTVDMDEDIEGWEEREEMQTEQLPEAPSLPVFSEDDEDAELKLMQVRFASAGRLYRFCQLFAFAEKVPSSLYEMEDSYILIMDLDACTRPEIGSFCMLVNEYATESCYGDLQASRVLEHGRLICDDAVYRIAQMKPIEK